MPMARVIIQCKKTPDQRLEPGVLESALLSRALMDVTRQK